MLLAAMALFLLVILAGCALQALVLPHNILLHDFSRTVPPLLFALLLSALLPLLMIAFSKNPVRPLLLLGAIAALTAGLAMPTSGMLDPLKTPAMLLIVCAALFAFRAARKPAAT
ncbi:hypothetical protein [Chitinimonas sp.]|uniref:hypothetical protein n=1 Tax=Chitinimonas sp. TaxID=1934313 RepID=UPI0035B1E1BE